MKMDAPVVDRVELLLQSRKLSPEPIETELVLHHLIFKMENLSFQLFNVGLSVARNHPIPSNVRAIDRHLDRNFLARMGSDDLVGMGENPRNYGFRRR